MKKKNFSKILSAVLCFVLVAVIALFASGCNEPSSSDDSGTKSSAPEGDDTEEKVYGEGKTVFTLSVTFANSLTETYTVKTDKTTVGEALEEVGLISGDEGPYGLYVKEVAGEKHDYNTDGKYWAFYINDKMSETGVDTTEIISGARYALKAEK